jgi:hypothetical protein
LCVYSRGCPTGSGCCGILLIPAWITSPSACTACSKSCRRASCSADNLRRGTCVGKVVSAAHAIQHWPGSQRGGRNEPWRRRTCLDHRRASSPPPGSALGARVRRPSSRVWRVSALHRGPTQQRLVRHSIACEPPPLRSNTFCAALGKNHMATLVASA